MQQPHIAAGQNGGVDFELIYSAKIYVMKGASMKCMHFMGNCCCNKDEE